MQSVISIVFRSQVEFPDATGNWPPVSQHREHEITQRLSLPFDYKNFKVMGDMFGLKKPSQDIVIGLYYDRFFGCPQVVSRLIEC